MLKPLPVSEIDFEQWKSQPVTRHYLAAIQTALDESRASMGNGITLIPDSAERTLSETSRVTGYNAALQDCLAVKAVARPKLKKPNPTGNFAGY